MQNSVIRASFLISCTALLFFSSCRKEIFVENGEGLDGWTTATHSNDVSPNYAVVFDQNQVHRIDIVLTSDEYNTMQTDLSDLLSSSSGPGADLSRNPIYVAADFYYNGIKWYEVGVRYKGNSSLKAAAQSGIKKLPLRLKFDRFEDDYPEIHNQRFYGFKDLSLSSGYKDQSFMREKTAPDLFREMGVPAPQTAFYEVWVDQGDGVPVYYGLYTMVEVVFDTMLEKMFGSSSGNCYKPDGEGARFASSGFDLGDFEKKTNEEKADWSDIQEFYDILHSSTRTSNTTQWMADLESIFDVDGFLKYLAVNNTIQNWDTYGNMTHNYYLYHDPADDLIKWVPWDNNEAFNSTGPGNRSPLSFEMNEVTSNWPIISYLKDIPEYRDIYDQYIDSFINGPFLPSKMNTEYSDHDMLISNSATSEISGYSFITSSANYSSAVSIIKAHASQRYTQADNYLN